MSLDTILIVPGLRGSGQTHWQSWMETQLPDAQRVEQQDWNTADLDVWSDRLREALVSARGSVWLVAHSFGCLVSACLIPEYSDRIAGAMLVAPADPDKFGVSQRIPRTAFDIPSVVVASTNDPWLRMMRAAWLADCWGSLLVNLGKAGHINADAGFGPWPEGLALLARLRGSSEGLLNGTLEQPLHADTQGRPL